MTHEHNPAFPVSLPGMGDNGASGLTQRAYAAIALKVPDSGEAWLDDMIRASRQMDLREQVMAAGLIEHPIMSLDIEQSARISASAVETIYPEVD